MMKYITTPAWEAGRLLFCPMWGDLRVLNSRFHVLDSGFLGSGFCSPDSNRSWDSGFHGMDSKALDSTSKNFQDSRIQISS